MHRLALPAPAPRARSAGVPPAHGTRAAGAVRVPPPEASPDAGRAHGGCTGPTVAGDGGYGRGTCGRGLR
ncbi:hypothetical protein BJP40_26305 [Streptomyces sp. CC53]|nr:hypothetical protein BJP40_26305 [Streptomyces sp. CC53]